MIQYFIIMINFNMNYYKKFIKLSRSFIKLSTKNKPEIALLMKFINARVTKNELRKIIKKFSFALKQNN